MKKDQNFGWPQRSLLLAFCLFNFAFCIISSSFAADWTQWRGPALNGSSDEAGLPASFSLPDHLKWSADLPGPAGSTPVVCGDRIFLTSADKANANLYMLCFGRADGRPLWKKTMSFAGRVQGRNRDASPSPVCDGKRIFFMFGNGMLQALDPDGNELWRRDLESEYGPMALNFIYSSSPLLYRGRLYVTVQRDVNTAKSKMYKGQARDLDSFLLCLDPATGKNIWKQTRPAIPGIPSESNHSYATPIPWEGLPGQIGIVTIGGCLVVSNDWQTGKELWRLPYGDLKGPMRRLVPTAVVAGKVLVAIEPRADAMFAMRLEGTAAAPQPKVLWKSTDLVPDVPSPLFYRGRVYALSDTRKVIYCIEPESGKRIWTGELVGPTDFYSSPTGADGKVYCMSLGSEVVVLEAGDAFKILSRVKLAGNPSPATIVPSNGNLIIRTAEKLYCIK